MQARRGLLALVLAAGGVVLAVQPAQSDAAYVELIVGAWDHANLKVLDATVTYENKVSRTVTAWAQNITRYAQEQGLTSSLGTIQLTYERLPVSPPGQPFTSQGVAGYYDIIVADTMTLGGIGCTLQTLCTTGYLLDELGITMLLPPDVRDLPVAQHKVTAPTLVLVPAITAGDGIITDALETDFVLHEFGHGLGLGHADVPPNLLDAMTHGPWTATQLNCISNLDMKTLATTYAFLPNAWQAPPASENIPTTSYLCRS